MNLVEIQDLIRRGQYEYSLHALQERLEDDLDAQDVERAILGSEILEEYPNDPRGESCLLLGFAGSRPVHVVLGWASRSDPSRGTHGS